MIAALALAAMLSVPAGAASTPDLASRTAAARIRYDAGRYDEAVSAFDSLVAASPDDAAFRYDLGNALFKAGHLGRAIANFERAFALDPRDSDIRFNLAYALRRAGEEFVPPGTPPALFWLFTALSERELAGLQWIAAWAVLLLAGAGLLSSAKRREALTPWTVASAAVWLFFVLWWSCLRAAMPPDRGVIVSAHAELRHGPGQNFGVAFTVPEGRRVRVLGQAGAWIEVGVLKEGVQGWIEADALERL